MATLNFNTKQIKGTPDGSLFRDENGNFVKAVYSLGLTGKKEYIQNVRITGNGEKFYPASCFVGQHGQVRDPRFYFKREL